MTLKGHFKCPEALMLTFHNLAFFLEMKWIPSCKWWAWKAFGYLSLIPCFVPYSRFLSSFTRSWSWSHHLSYHFLLHPRSLTLTRLPSFSVPLQNERALFSDHLLSCSRPTQHPSNFPKDPFPGNGGPIRSLSPSPLPSQASLSFIPLPIGLFGPSCPFYFIG